jgi:hypothetical protein
MATRNCIVAEVLTAGSSIEVIRVSVRVKYSGECSSKVLCVSVLLKYIVRVCW